MNSENLTDFSNECILRAGICILKNVSFPWGRGKCLLGWFGGGGGGMGVKSITLPYRGDILSHFQEDGKEGSVGFLLIEL